MRQFTQKNCLICNETVLKRHIKIFKEFIEKNYKLWLNIYAIYSIQ